MALGDLLAWWNLVFLLPGAAGLCLAFLSTTDEREDDVAAPEEASQSAGHALDAAGRVLALLGVGRLPLALLLTVLLTAYGAIGLAANRALSSLPALLPVSLAFAVSGSLLVSALVSRVLARVVPPDETCASSFESLVGCSGKVVSVLPPAEGYAQVRDHLGNVQEVRCRNLTSTPLRAGERVVVARVESDQRLCVVVEVAGEESRMEKGGWS